MAPSRRQVIAGAGAGVAATVLANSRRVFAAHAKQVRAVAQTVTAIPHVDGAGVQLNKLIGQSALRHLDPFVLLDRFHSNNPADYQAGFPDHPHRGFETVTIMLSGTIRHRDSRGNHGDIGSGGVQWMTAGRGIVHSEMPQPAPGWMSGFQLWLNLPAREKMRAPEYQDLQAERIAHGRVTAAGSGLSVIAGEIDGLKGPVRPRATEPTLATMIFEDDRPLAIDVRTGHAAFVFVSEGVIEVGDGASKRLVRAGTLAVLSPGNRIVLRAPTERSACLLAAAKPLGEPIVQGGPFVMNTEEEIRRAFDDYRNGRLTQ